jgi:hypothetical protein
MGRFTARLSKALEEEFSVDPDSSGHPKNDEAQNGAPNPVKKRHAVCDPQPEKDPLARSIMQVTQLALFYMIFTL